MKRHRSINRLLCWALVFSTGCLALTGCSWKSRWAMRDTNYAEHYPQHSDDPLQIAKQMSDARHVAHSGGAFVSAAGINRDHNDAGAFEVGMFQFHEPWLEQRFFAGSTVMARDGGYFHLGTGARIQSPTRLAPFIGADAKVGIGMVDFIDEVVFGNDDPHLNCDPNQPCESHETDAIIILEPEAGVHYWITPSLRVTGSVGYAFSTSGRQHDTLQFNLEFGFRKRHHYGRSETVRWNEDSAFTDWLTEETGNDHTTVGSVDLRRIPSATTPSTAIR